MTPQSINDQLELLRLKELFMSDIEIRSKMAVLISTAHENSNFKEFCELTNCTPEVAKTFSQLFLLDVMLTPEEIKAERERLERLKHDTL